MGYVMVASEHLSGNQFGSWKDSNNDPNLGTLMKGRSEPQLTHVPVDQILGGVSLNSRKVSAYAKMPTPLPPGVGVRGKEGVVLFDGNHRAAAAKKRGDSTFPAWVSSGSWEPPRT